MNPSSFQVSGLSLDQFQSLFDLSDAELAARGARRCIVDEKPSYPCRVSLEDAEIGETVLLLSYEHHAVEGPYRGAGPIYVRERAIEARLRPGDLPQVVRERMISVRAYDSNGFLISSDVVEGAVLKSAIMRFFEDANVAYLHLHNAKPGCYSCRVDRA